MKLQIKPFPWSCAATSMAMVLDIEVDRLHVFLGHNGGNRVNDLPEPMCRRGVHMQELIDVAYGLYPTRLVMPYELAPAIATSDGQIIPVDTTGRKTVFQHIIATERGVLTGQGRCCQHAVAFEKNVIYDPDGRQFPFSFEECEARNFYPQCAWLVKNIG